MAEALSTPNGRWFHDHLLTLTLSCLVPHFVDWPALLASRDSQDEMAAKSHQEQAGGQLMSDREPESTRKRWNDIKRTVFTIAVTVTILAVVMFVAVSVLAT